MVAAPPGSIDETVALLAGQNYVCGRPLATVAYLSMALGKPLFLEREAGVGKRVTEPRPVCTVAADEPDVFGLQAV